jgi:hypothetical protein
MDTDIIEVDAPCLLSLRDGKVVVADPTHKSKALMVSVNGKRRTINLPSGTMAGSQVDVEL